MPAATTTTLGGVIPDGTTITVDNSGKIAAPQYSLPTASTTVKGGVIPDGTTITVNPSTGVATANTVTFTTLAALALATKTTGQIYTVSKSNGATINAVYNGSSMAGGWGQYPSFSDLSTDATTGFLPSGDYITPDMGLCRWDGTALAVLNVSGITNQGNGNPLLTPIKVPSGFPWIPPANFFRTANGKIVTDFDANRNIAIPNKIYYVDLVNGSDSAAGSKAAPFLTIAKALTVTGDQIQIINMTSDVAVLCTSSYFNSFQSIARSGSLVVMPNSTTGITYRVQLISSSVSTLPTWSAVSGYSGVYSVSYTSSGFTNGAGAVDLSKKTIAKNGYSLANCPAYLIHAAATTVDGGGTTASIIAVTTINSNSITVSSTSSGLLGVGQKITGTGIPDNSVIISLGSYSGGAGVILINNPATATGSGISLAATSPGSGFTSGVTYTIVYLGVGGVSAGSASANVIAGTSASFTGSLTSGSNILTVTGTPTGTIIPGTIITGPGGTSLGGLVIQSYGTGSTTGTGGSGTYQLSGNASSTVSETMNSNINYAIGGTGVSLMGTISGTTLTVQSVLAGSVMTGQSIASYGTVMQKLSATTWQMSASNTVSTSTSMLGSASSFGTFKAVTTGSGIAYNGGNFSASSLPNCQANPGTYHNDGSYLYVSPVDGRTADTSILPLNNSSSLLRFTVAASNLNYTFKGLDFIGSTRPFNAYSPSGASFSGTISGTTLTITTAIAGTIAINQALAGSGVTAGTTITGGSGNIWTLSTSSTVSTAVAMTTAYPTLSSTLIAPTNAIPAYTGIVLNLINCTFQGSVVSGQSNGLNWQANYTGIIQGCGSYFNAADDLNYHSYESGNLGNGQWYYGTSPNILEFNCFTFGSGTTGFAFTSNNASTVHDFVYIVRFNNIYFDSYSRPMADVYQSKSWVIQCFIGGSRAPGATMQNVLSEDFNQMWLDSCTFGTNNQAAPLSTIGNGVINYFNCGTINNDVYDSAEATNNFQLYYG